MLPPSHRQAMACPKDCLPPDCRPFDVGEASGATNISGRSEGQGEGNEGGERRGTTGTRGLYPNQKELRMLTLPFLAQRRIQAIKDKRAAKEEKARFAILAEKMHAKRLARLKRKEKRNKMLNS